MPGIQSHSVITAGLSLWMSLCMLCVPATQAAAHVAAATAADVSVQAAKSTQATVSSQMLADAEQRLAQAKQAENPAATAEALDTITQLHSQAGNYGIALTYATQAAQLWEELHNRPRQTTALLEVGTAYWRVGNYDKALEYCLAALKIAEALNDPTTIANALHNMGIVNDLLEHYPVALDYHHRALEIRQRLKEPKGIADSLSNIGVIHYLQHDYPQALDYALKSLQARETANDLPGIGKSLNNAGLAYRAMNQSDKAFDYYRRALAIWEKIGYTYEIANIFNNIGELYIQTGEYAEATKYLNEALQKARQIDAKALMRENYEFYSDFYFKQNNYQAALEYYKMAAEIKDSLYNEKSQKLIVDMQTKYETDKKEQQITLLKKDNQIQQLAIDSQLLQRNSLLGGLVLVFITAFLIYNRYRFARQVNRQLEEANELVHKEKEKSDRLLLNILPVRVANDLKEKGKTEPESFENVTVYFSDVVGFTKLSSQLEPKYLIDELNSIFTAFDNIIEKHQCERVKTIGDAYLCVCGMPTPNPQHAPNMVRAAVEIINYMKARNRDAPVIWEIRIGIHTGPVVGGVVGIKKYIYDVFGDTINTASRMESNSEPMRINISASTYQFVKDEFDITPRGILHVKGKGDMPMYFVNT